MYGKLLTHLRDQRSKQTSLFHFTEEVHILITYLIITSGIETKSLLIFILRDMENC